MCSLACTHIPYQEAVIYQNRIRSKASSLKLHPNYPFFLKLLLSAVLDFFYRASFIRALTSNLLNDIVSNFNSSCNNDNHHHCSRHNHLNYNHNHNCNYHNNYNYNYHNNYNYNYNYNYNNTTLPCSYLNSTRSCLSLFGSHDKQRR